MIDLLASDLKTYMVLQKLGINLTARHFAAKPVRCIVTA